jgi:ubiquinone/menaquinone biosynthesis C-methylase UbiE
MKNDAWHHAWSQVDQTEDPGFFVRFLDSTRLPMVRAAALNPGKYYEHLCIQPGQSVLEIGCGVGDLLGPLAELVGPQGRVVGIDISQTMIAEARFRAKRAGAPVEFLVGDAHALKFTDNEFDHATAVAVWQHLEDPEKALSEAIRVIKPGGRVTIIEADWDTQVVDSPDCEITRKIVHFYADSIRNGTIARHLPALMQAQGLRNISVSPGTAVAKSPREAMWLWESAERAASAGVIAEEEAQSWLADLEERAGEDRYFSAFTTFCVAGVKPVTTRGK